MQQYFEGFFFVVENMFFGLALTDFDKIFCQTLRRWTACQEPETGCGLKP